MEVGGVLSMVALAWALLCEMSCRVVDQNEGDSDRRALFPAKHDTCCSGVG